MPSYIHVTDACSQQEIKNSPCTVIRLSARLQVAEIWNSCQLQGHGLLKFGNPGISKSEES